MSSCPSRLYLSQACAPPFLHHGNQPDGVDRHHARSRHVRPLRPAESTDVKTSVQVPRIVTVDVLIMQRGIKLIEPERRGYSSLAQVKLEESVVLSDQVSERPVGRYLECPGV